ncbi:zinc-dependent alcohol dehydrogenase family protein [Sphingomonas aliaeris]|uniref:Zinc-dependent alcohol dehydrogenase family protein n=1 Tax=Sphingomonas aliaeris TaxID=2759526 RepID=A0A974NVA9_9SPHN|nr:zinc-dependent alcohol dehydrogenase family protein [Sphingomonas aliaeris]QQV77550.1 zinc-dependent alcohol dehydrogenase family protein [Sphingomonas aliaeris]
MIRAVRIHGYGDASVLRIENVEVLAPAANEVQIKVKAIGINRAEVMFRTHTYLQEASFPSRLGYEASGVVEMVGASVTGFVVGDVVSVIPSLDITDGGTYGELVNVQSRLVVRHPENLSFEEAAAVWMPYVTAWGALIEQAKLCRGEAVIISAASSSVGIAAFQIAKIVGATVIATTRTGAKRQALLDAGADHVVATDEEDLVARVLEITHGSGARVVFDPVGGPSFGPLTASMARGGILLEYGVLSAEPTPFPLLTVLSKSLTLKGYLYTEVVSDDAILVRAKTFITDGLVSGALRPLIARTFAFADIQDAHRFLESNEQIGKVVVTV